MEEISIIDFLKQEIHYFRELLSFFIAEEHAYKEPSHPHLTSINERQKQILDELKSLRPERFKPFHLSDEIERSVLYSLKEQLDSLLDQLNLQKERNQYLKTLSPKLEKQTHPPLLKTQVCQLEDMEDDVC